MDKWNLKKRPVCLEKRFEFESYTITRDFLDRLGDYCEKVKRYPDISFGKTYVNITLRPEDDSTEAKITSSEHQFAEEIDRLL
ncbi:4a-hydroxytetrahydrobiopterin dehydratase [Prochlorococcus sp. MIT 1223]|uniref:4a-hydroxytetrahydrobiopterin dehydratase n=1 Tax=Prochlorococcus sp. MIT 1223 TaxID=3096217 RepID=UPI002A762B22|nr:4a-hydroxytetrahydrobiopterin dehydratase [Prochlorococcus sp. MIT 1223]